MRFIDFGDISPDFSKAIEATMIESHSKGGIETLWIYSDSQDVISYGITLKRSEFDDEEGSYEMICEGMIASLEHMGIIGEFEFPNKILAEGKKISESSQIRNETTVLQKGTLISDSSDSDYTSINEIIGDAPTTKEVSFAIMFGFAETLGVPIDFGELTDIEKKRIEEIQNLN